jgi:PAS domain S-box-containing protein
VTISGPLTGDELLHASPFEELTIPLLICERESLLIVDANSAALKLFGAPRQGLVGMRLPAVSRAYPQLCDGLETRSPVPLGNLFMVVALGELAEESRRLRKLERDAERFALISRATSDAVWEWDLRERGLWWNEAFERLFGYSAGEVGATMDFWFRCIPEDERAVVAEGVTRLLHGTTEHFWLCEHGFMRANGTRAEVSDRAFVVRDDAGRAVKVVGGMVDITEQKRIQSALRSSERLSTMGSLLADVAHEVRNPLFAMSAICDAYEAEHGKGTASERYFSFLRGELQRLSSLMQDLLDYGRPTPPARQRNSLTALIASAIHREQVLARHPRVSLALIAEENLPEVSLDASRMLQVFQNLLQNAMQYSPEGESVTVRVRLSDDGKFLECAVEDRGAGFSEADLSRVFEPFYSRRRGGTGIGLAIVQRIVQDHQGTISAENRPDGGAAIRLRLPVADAEGR